MHTKLGIHFPVYLMITKLDLLHGFNEFFNHLTEEQRNQYLGILHLIQKEWKPLSLLLLMP